MNVNNKQTITPSNIIEFPGKHRKELAWIGYYVQWIQKLNLNISEFNQEFSDIESYIISIFTKQNLDTNEQKDFAIPNFFNQLEIALSAISGNPTATVKEKSEFFSTLFLFLDSILKHIAPLNKLAHIRTLSLQKKVREYIDTLTYES